MRLPMVALDCGFAARAVHLCGGVGLPVLVAVATRERLFTLTPIYRNMYTDMRHGKRVEAHRIGLVHRSGVCGLFPREVRIDIGHALFAAQEGKTDPAAKPLKGFGGANVLEIIASHHGNAWRAVYTVRFQDAIYVLHVF